MDLAEFRCAPYGKALKRPSKQRSKTGSQEKVTILLQNSKIIEKPIDKRYNRIRKEREANTMKEYKFLVRVYFKDGTKEQRT